MLKLIKKLKNQRGNILISTFMSIVILSMSVAGIAQLTVQQFNYTKQKVENVNEDLLGEALLEQSLYDFEMYLLNNDYDLDGYLIDMTNNGINDYGILVEDVSGMIIPEDDVDFSDYDGIKNFVYRFTYTYNEGTSRMVMYEYITNAVSFADAINPLDFQIATNGTLLVNSGYLDEPRIYANEIIFSNVAPFINRATNTQDKTPNDGYYPDFKGDGSKAEVYHDNGFFYCEPNCYDVSGTINDPFIFENSEIIDIANAPTSIETGDINPETIASDFFGDFDLADRIVTYVSEEGPTEDRVINATLDINTLGQEVWDNYSGAPNVEEYIWWRGWWRPPIIITYYTPSDKQYTRLNDLPSFDPENDEEELDFAGIYQGDLTISNDFTIENMDSDQTETLIVYGDLYIDNPDDIEIFGYIVVLGDLYFLGDTVKVSGGFFVTGQTYVDFNPKKGFINPSTNDYQFSLMTMDNIFVTSLYETHRNIDYSERFNWFVYTDESIFIDAVNNKLEMKGVLFAAAKGVSGHDLPIVNENGEPIRGIVINSFNGYIDNSGNAHIIDEDVNNFDIDAIKANELDKKFIEMPDLGLLATVEGEFSIYRSELYYYNNN